jgi:phosphate transport system protein
VHRGAEHVLPRRILSGEIHRAVQLEHDVASRTEREEVHSDEVGSDPERLEWGLRMITVSRCLERIGDHAVDIGEQVAYLVTGEFREFTDASRRSDSPRA